MKQETFEKAVSSYDSSLDRNLAHFYLLDQYNKAYGLNTASSSKNSLSMIEMSYRANPAYGSALERSLSDYLNYGIKDIMSFEEYCSKAQWEVNIINRICEAHRRMVNQQQTNVINGLHEGFPDYGRGAGITKPNY